MRLDKDGTRHCVETADFIYGLFGKYRPLSNFHRCYVEVDGVLYQSSESAYMAQKTIDPEIRNYIATLTNPADAKRFGKTMELRKDWEQYKSAAMLKVLICKFGQNEDIRKLLLDTKEKCIVETNNWKDHYWGVCYKTGVGSNMLGKILMDVRSIYKTCE